MNEIMVYQQMGNEKKANQLTKEYFKKYPNDSDLKDAYLVILIESAKSKMANELYKSAITDWNEVIDYGDKETRDYARYNIFNCYQAMNDDERALSVLNDIILYEEEENLMWLEKRAAIYNKQKKHNRTLTVYEQILSKTKGEEKEKYLNGYEEIIIPIIKELNEQERYPESKSYVERWLEHDPYNTTALRYGINLAHQTKDKDLQLLYAQRGNEQYPENLFFKLKLMEIESENSDNYEKLYAEFHQNLQVQPYHSGLINSFSQLTENYSAYLIREKQPETAIIKLDTALIYDQNNASLKYLKGLAFEKMKKFDSAYYYQSFYTPSPIELQEFKLHLNYLQYKSYRNEVSLQHLRSRFADRYTISTISTFEYTRINRKNNFTGRINYAGRENGRGFQGQLEWIQFWSDKTSSKLNFALADNFFPKIQANASIYRYIDKLPDIELEIGAGFRRLTDTLVQPIFIYRNMYNIVVGITQQKDEYMLNLKLNNFFFNQLYLFNLTASSRFYIGTLKNYVSAMAGFGTSPDVDLINYQLYDGFSVLNVMVGAGYNHQIYRNFSFGVLGTWYNYKTNPTSNRNLYNLYLNINVAF